MRDVFCIAHGLTKADSELVVWLVQSHLVMSSVAQKSDLSDPVTIKSFAKLVSDERHLIALYLLTVADIRGTSPKVWNAWKAKLLENLFFSTQRLLKGAAMSADSELEARQAKARITLSHYGILEDAYRPLWDKFGQQYFLRHEGPEIAWHTRMLLSHLNSASPVVRARLSPSGDGIQAMIYTKDRDDLFAHICSFFERMNYTIVEAKIHTTEHGYAINSFIVLDQSDKSVIYRDLLSFIEYELTVKLLSKNAPDAPSQGRVSRQVKHMPITPRVNLTPDTNGMSHTLELIASDRPGLLSRIAHVFLDHGVALHTAKINTLGNRAEDVFLISGKFGKKLSDNCAKTLGKDLLAKL